MRDLARFSTTALVLAGAMLCAGEQSRGQAGSGSTQFRVAHNRVWGIRLGVSDETWGDPNWHAPLGTGARLFLGNGDEPFARDGEQGVSVRAGRKISSRRLRACERNRAFRPVSKRRDERRGRAQHIDHSHRLAGASFGGEQRGRKRYIDGHGLEVPVPS